MQQRKQAQEQEEIRCKQLEEKQEKLFKIARESQENLNWGSNSSSQSYFEPNQHRFDQNTMN